MTTTQDKIAELERKRDGTLFEAVRQHCQREIDRLRSGLSKAKFDAERR